MKPITALIGPNDTYKREFIQNALKKIAPEDVTVYYADDHEPGVIFSQCGQNSLFSANNIIIVKNIDSMPDKSRKAFDESLENYIKNSNPDTTLILWADKFGADILSLIRESGEVIEFKKMYKNELIKYINEKLNEKIIHFDSELPDFIVSIANDDSDEVEMILQLLSSFSSQSKNITIENAKSLLSRSNNMNIFNLIDGIFKHDLKEALHALEDLKLSGEPLTRVNYMVLRASKNLWSYLALKNKNDATYSLKIKPYEAKMLSEYARSSDLKFVSSVIELVKRVETMTKTMADEFAYLELETFILGTSILK